ncbi:MAG TPA: ankyrin repeat domain-containing protein [Gammaproteobacteria bacterium]|nr:ankyrin repeat domain-containing protein [Gammaproteobacteria bacterium]
MSRAVKRERKTFQQKTATEETFYLPVYIQPSAFWSLSHLEDERYLASSYAASQAKFLKLESKSKNKKNLYALHDACREGDIEKIRLLLSQKVDIEMRNEHGLTALHVAVMKKKLEVVKILIENKADIESCVENNPLIYTPLVGAAYGYPNLSIAEYLIRQEANMDVLDNQGETLLQLVARFSDRKMLHLLVQWGAKIGSKPDLIRCAEEGDDPRIIELCKKPGALEALRQKFLTQRREEIQPILCFLFIVPTVLIPSILHYLWDSNENLTIVWPRLDNMPTIAAFKEQFSKVFLKENPLFQARLSLINAYKDVPSFLSELEPFVSAQLIEYIEHLKFALPIWIKNEEESSNQKVDTVSPL